MTTPSIVAQLVKLYTRGFIRSQPQGPEGVAAQLRRSMNHTPLLLTLLPKGVVRSVVYEPGLTGDRLSVREPTQTLLYLHGGGYLAGIPRTYHNLCGRLAAKLSAQVFVPIYRLAPEAPFPAACDDALAAYRALLAKGLDPARITIIGDSAGGGLTLATLLAIRDLGLPRPRCGVAISPWTDLTCKNASIDANDSTDAMLSARMLRMAALVYLNGADATTPYASPRFGDYTGLPPLLLTACEHECLRDDSLVVADKARQAGVRVELIVRPDLLHVWPIFVPTMPEAQQDLAHLANFIAQA
jgi:monoterpene epsilon-lactone hydrolase